MLTNKNLILDTDSYKLSHFKQYDPSVDALSSYIESRGVSPDFPYTDKLVFFGLQAWIRENLGKPITKEMIQEAKIFAEMHGEPFNAQGWEQLSVIGGQHLPLEIQAIPEGSVVPLRTPLVQVRTFIPELKWLGSYLETSMLRGVWYPSTVATLSYLMKERIKPYWDISVDLVDMAGLEFALHDFGARGASSYETAGLGGMAHLLNFKGTDTITGIVFAQKYYDAVMPGFSVPAAEHSTIMSWGRDREYEAVDNMIESYGGPGKIYSVVGDTYDIYNFVNMVTGVLHDKIKAKGGRFVIRPDSGEPDIVLTKIMKIFETKGLYRVNGLGYKVLPDHFRILWGDGIDYYSVAGILECMLNLGWSSENFVFGMGGALLQKVNRDSLKFAMKLNAITKYDGDGLIPQWDPVSKNPLTDPGKASKAGYIKGIPTVFSWGENIQNYTFDQVRTNVLKGV